MRKLKRLIPLLFILLLACENEVVLNCFDCLTSRPVEGELKIEVTQTQDYIQSMSLQVYQGKVETGILIHEEYLEFWLRESFTFEVPLNQYYSVRCIYNTDDGDYAVIDGTFLKAKKIEYLECDTDCWTIRGGLLKAKL